MPAFTALLAQPTDISTSTRGRTSSARSSSRSTCRSGCGPSSRRPSWKGETVALGTNTDPYQWVEGRYRLTRAVWEVLIEARNPGSVLTKSPLLLRDIDLFKQLNEVAGFQASLSIPTVEEKAWRATEPRTPHPMKRIEAVGELSRAGIPVGVLIAPLMPGINDSPAQVERVLRLCAEAGRAASGASGSTSRARSARSSSTGCAPTARTSCRATRSSTPPARSCRGRSATGSAGSSPTGAAGPASAARVAPLARGCVPRVPPHGPAPGFEAGGAQGASPQPQLF